MTTCLWKWTQHSSQSWLCNFEWKHVYSALRTFLVVFFLRPWKTTIFWVFPWLLSVMCCSRNIQQPKSAPSGILSKLWENTSHRPLNSQMNIGTTMAQHSENSDFSVGCNENISLFDFIIYCSSWPATLEPVTKINLFLSRITVNSISSSLYCAYIECNLFINTH